MARSLFFDFHGIALQLNFQTEVFSEYLIEQLRADFFFFERQSLEKKSGISVDIREKAGAAPFSGTTWFHTALCEAKQEGRMRRCRFSDGTQIDDSGLSDRQATLWVQTPERGYEALYYYILSAIGEALDRKGLHRLHAVAATSASETRCWPRDSMGGKTSRALKILEIGADKLFGDELVFTDGRKLYPFPIRLAVRPDIYKAGTAMPAQSFERSLGGLKYLVKIPQHRVAIETQNFILDIEGTGFRFVVNFLLGLGVPQMREFMIRPNSLKSLGWIFLSRLVCLGRLLRYR